jgi:hypothetical protein
MMGPDPANLVRISNVLRSAEQSPEIQGDLVVISESSIDAHSVAAPYFIGTLPTSVYVQWYLSERPWIVSLLMLFGVLTLALTTFQLMKIRALKRGIEVTT